MKTTAEFIKDTYGENWTTKSDWMSGDVFNVMEDYAKYYHNELGGLPLPKDYISTKTNLPDNGETVMVLTNLNRNTIARFEKFLGNEIWETDYDCEDNEKVIGWKKQ